MSGDVKYPASQVRATAERVVADLCLWRAAQIELNARRRMADKEKGLIYVVSTLGMRTEADPEYEKRLDAHMQAVKRSSAAQTMEVWNKQSGDTVLIVRDGWTFTLQGVAE